MFNIRSRKIVLSLVLIMLWMATPARAEEWSHDDLMSRITSRILKWITSADTVVIDDYLPKPPPPPVTIQPEEPES